MQDRGVRRAKTEAYARRAAEVWFRSVKGYVLEGASFGRFRKGKALGCRCRRHPAGRPKVTRSCHLSSGHYQNSTMERIVGRRFTHAWEREGDEPSLARHPDRC